MQKVAKVLRVVKTIVVCFQLFVLLSATLGGCEGPAEVNVGVMIVIIVIGLIAWLTGGIGAIIMIVVWIVVAIARHWNGYSPWYFLCAAVPQSFTLVNAVCWLLWLVSGCSVLDLVMLILG